MPTWRGSVQAAEVTTLSTLATALLFATRWQGLPAVRGDEAPTQAQSTFVCHSGSRQFSVAANSSWQAVTIQAQNQNFTGECSLNVSAPASVDEHPSVAVPSQPLQQQLLPRQVLLKIDQVKLATASNGTCEYDINSLNVFIRNRSWNTGYICNVSSVFIWTNESFEMYMYAKTSFPSAPWFSVAFIVAAELINMCCSACGSAELLIDRELYVFAPDSRYSEIPPNYIICSNGNYTMTLLASNASGGLGLAVLASPPSSSCCSLLLDGQRCGNGNAQSFGPSNRFKLLYSCTDCRDDNKLGFTLRVTVVSAKTIQTSTTSDESTATPTSTSSTHSDTYARDAATLITSATSSTSTRPLNITALSVRGSSLLSSTLSVTFASDVAPVSPTNCPPELNGVISCSPSPSPTTSMGVSDDDPNGAASDVSLVVGAVVGSVLGVTIVATVSTVVARRRCCLNGAKAGAFQTSSGFRQSETAPWSHLSLPVISNGLSFETAPEESAADLHISMVDNDLYVTM